MPQDMSRHEHTASVSLAGDQLYEDVSMYHIPAGSEHAVEDIASIGDEEALDPGPKKHQGGLPSYADAINKSVPWWSLHSGWTMYGLLLLGLGFAVGHHQYYLSLHGTPADDQTKKLRYGTLLAFLTKASLVAAVIAAFRQRVWSALASEPLALKTVDCLTAAPSDLLAMFNREFFKKTKVVVLMASFTWQVTFLFSPTLPTLSPIIVILASQALSVEPTVDVTTCPGVKVLNFTRESSYDFANPPQMDGRSLVTTSRLNVTSINISDPQRLLYYDGPIGAVKTLATAAFFQDAPVAASDASSMACGHGWDCTFTVKFRAPGYKCDDIIIGGVRVPDTDNIKLPFDAKLLLPEGLYSYFAITQLGEYAKPQISNVSIAGIPTFDPPWPAHLGVFRTEPVLWIGYSNTLLPFDQIPENYTTPGWKKSFAPNIFRCQNYETEYTVKFEYVGGLQNIQVLDREYVAPILDTILTQDTASDGTEDTTVAVPESAYVYPKDRRYHYVAAYHSFGSVFRDCINGSLYAPTKFVPLEFTNALSTRLFDKRQFYFPFPDLKQRLQSLFENLILSIFSQPSFTIVTWAAAPDRPVGPLESDRTFGYPCTRSKAQNRFRYHAQDLWIVYGISLGCTVAAVAMGTISVVQTKGVLKNTRYSSIAVLLQRCGIEYDVLRGQPRMRIQTEEN